LCLIFFFLFFSKRLPDACVFTSKKNSSGRESLLQLATVCHITYSSCFAARPSATSLSEAKAASGDQLRYENELTADPFIKEVANH